MKVVYFLVAFLALASSIAFAYDPSPLQDFCVAVNENNGVFVNGKFCKDPKLVKAEDFFTHVEPGNTSNKLGSKVTPVTVTEIAGLNTLGISLVRIDYAPKGLNPPHTHPRGTEILIVVEGTLNVGFVASNQNNNTLFTKVLNKGDVFVFPIGLIHFQLNVGNVNAIAIAGLSSQNPVKDKMKVVYFLVAFLALASSIAFAYDPSPLQDFCVAVNENNGVFVNGKFCKDPKLVKAEDFFTHVEPGNTSNKLGSKVTPVTVTEIAGLNTLGISLARIDFAPKGLNPPHTHPRGTEILIVVEGTLYVGFVASNQNNNTLFTKVLNKGDVFVFPIGLIHFQLNVGNVNAIAIAGLSSQNPGVITIANALFGSTPLISFEVLTKAFQVNKYVIQNLEKQFL
ncbi:hypothetical protein Lal_00017681 [Lupinus albus]|nr:hypothetical protein Lal_00017681 [Lupinus albus]